jgi:hypothetical protein
MNRISLVFSLLVVSLLLAACGGTKTCSNCSSGCCDASGTCQAGTSSQLCGQNGNTCTECSAGQTCTLGACRSGSGGGAGGGGGGAQCSGNGVCSGTTAEWCPSGGTSGSLDCATVMGQCAVPSSFGAWCSVGTGKTCKVANTHASYLYCGDSTGPLASLACDQDNGCVATTAPACTPGSVTKTCAGADQLVVDCTPWGQPVVQSCSGTAVGGTGCNNNTCVGIAAGKTCDATHLCGMGTACDTGSHTCVAFTPGMHSAPPQVVNLGGSVLGTPKVMAILVSSDSHQTIMNDYLTQLSTDSYWAATTSEYGVGPITIGTAQTIASTPTTDMGAVALISANTDGGTWGAPDPQTVYTFLIPEGTNFDDGTGSKCCQGYSGYHDDANVNGVDVPYAIVCECPGFDYQGEPIDISMTATISHELVEAATDPYPNSGAAWGQTDDDHAAWTIWTGGEVADMCTFNSNFPYTAPGAQFISQKSWSNAAAMAGQDPCVPADPVPFAAVTPTITTSGTINYYGNWMTKAVTVPTGSSAMIDVQAYTSAPSGPFTVNAYDFTNFWQGGTAHLNLTLDTNTANNGDTLHLTIAPQSFDNMLHGALFLVEVDFDGGVSYAMGTVVQ